jgi:Spy/CpxP family protein refolding chaperone
VSHVLATLVLSILLIGPSLAQHGHGSRSPYAGLERRAVKALSSDEIADLRAGRGMGLALPAELNGYPGPVHVLEHAGSLALSGEQRARVQALYEAMRAEAIPLGERLIGEETHLDRLFAERTVTADSLARATAEIGATQAALRAAHLKYHLAMMGVLTPAQIERYGALRGYVAEGAGHHGGGRAKH